MSGARKATAVPLSNAVGTWVKVALLSFGGPAGQIAVMHQLIVDERRWVDEDRFLHAMSYCMLLPGPEAQQLATYLGWLLHGTRGGLVAGLLFILPGLISIFVLSVLYSAFRDVALVEALFYGLKPAVIAVVLAALLRIGRRTLIYPSRVALAAGAFIGIFFFGVPFPLIILAAGAYGLWARPPVPVPPSDRGPTGPGMAIHEGRRSEGHPSLTRPSVRAAGLKAAFWIFIWIAPVTLLVAAFGKESVFVDEAIFFGKAAVVTFGGAYAVLAYIAQQAVDVYQWLAPGEMLDGLGMAETTPGPLIQVVQFVGYMGAYRNPGELSPFVAGAIGSLVTAWVTFVPCFLFVFVGAPFAEYLRGHQRIEGALKAITASIVGVILNLAVWFAVHTVFGTVGESRFGPIRVLVPEWASVDIGSLVLAFAASIAMLRYHLGMMTTLGTAAGAGMVFRFLTG